MIINKTTCSLICFFVSTAFAVSKTNDGTMMQLTKEVKNNDRALSPDGRWLAYIKISNYVVPSDCFYPVSKGEHGDEIWIADLKTMKKRLLVANHFSCGDVKKVILDPHHLEFSPDSKTLFFETSAWVVSGAIHAVDVNGKNLRFVTDGGEYRIIQNGLNKGNLIVNQHRYHDGGGSYNWDWLYTPAGKQIKLYKKED
jgi:hypothetical protein